MFVVTPSTVVPASAPSRRRSAVARSGPHAMTLASIGSYRLLTTMPSARPESTRTWLSQAWGAPAPHIPPGAGSRSASTVPPVGRKPRAGSSA